MTWSPASGDIIDVIVNWTLTTGVAQNHFGLECTGLAETVETLALAMKTAIIKNTADGILRGHHDTISIGSLTFNDVKPGTRAPYIYSFTPVAGDAGAVDDLPPQDAMVVTFRTLLKGRAYRGRMYLPGWSEGAQSNGTWGAAYTGYANDFATELRRLYDGDTVNPNYRLGVISRFLNGVERVTPVITPVVSHTVRSTVYTQRRRTVGHGV